MSWPILSVTVFLPLVGALFIMTLRGDDAAVERNARWVALWTTLITLAISLVLIWRFDASSASRGRGRGARCGSDRCASVNAAITGVRFGCP